MNTNSSGDKKPGFDVRIVDFKIVHNQKQEDFDAFIKIIDPKPGQVILDGMDGYGATSKEVLAYTTKLGFTPEIFTLDESEVQIERARKNVPSIDSSHIIKSDMRKTPFADNFFDTVVIKMGIHEVPKHDQQQIVNEAYRILKSGGKFVTWELSFLDNETQVVFQDIIRKKDEIACFERLVEDRYFPRRDELLNLFSVAGFKDIKVAHEIDAKLSLRVRESELVSKDRKEIMNNKGNPTSEEEVGLIRLGQERCNALVEFTKEYMSKVSANVKEKMNYSESENDIQFKPNKEIIVGYK